MQRSESEEAPPALPTEPEPEAKPAGQPPAHEPDPAVAPEVPVLPGVEPEIDVLEMNVAQVLADPALTALAIEAMSAKLADATARKKAIQAEIAQLNAKNELLKRVQARQPAPKGPPAFAAIHAQMARDAAARVERRQALAGFTKHDLLELTRTGSPLDEAMKARRPGVEGVRPAARMPAHA